jgi:UDP-glucose 4-epimerase
MNILVTGGAGYIGSHATLALRQLGYDVTVLDNLENGHFSNIEYIIKTAGEIDFINCDLRNIEDLRNKLPIDKFDAVIHFAAYIDVGLSVQKPEIFFENNLVGSQNLLQVMVEKNIKKIIFSSTAAVYGTPKVFPIPETASKHPESPYGTSKLLVEKLLKTYSEYKDIDVVILRYFNPAGAYSEQLGERHDPETHVIPRLLKAYLDSNFKFGVYGNNYDTPDGSAIRDYIHIMDLVDAHITCLKYLKSFNGIDTFNVGTGKGVSVFELIEIASKITSKQLAYDIQPKREGDPAILIADPSKINNQLGWHTQYSIEQIVQSAWDWEQSRINF